MTERRPRTLLVIITLVAGACTTDRALDRADPAPAPAPAPTPKVIAVDANPVDVSPAPYPPKAIERATTAVASKCGGLVYKQGCRSLRKGTVKVRVTLGTDEPRLDILANTVTQDAGLVEKCAIDTLTKWKFDAPSPSTSPTFELTLVLSDMC